MNPLKHYKLALLLLSAVIGAGWYIYACGWHPPVWEITNSAFAPEVTTPKGNYNSLFYTKQYSFYSYIGWDSDYYTEANVADWCVYLDKAMPAKKVRHLMQDKEVMSEILRSKNNKHITDKRLRNFFTFLEIARGNEATTIGDFDPWDYEDRNYKQLEATEPQRVEALYRSLKSDVFFTNRIWFQAVRLKFYSQDRSSVIPFFEETAASQPKNTLYYRAMHYGRSLYSRKTLRSS